MKSEPDEERAHKAFITYCEAKAIAEVTGDFRDAIAAGRCWVQFLNTFLPEHRQMPVSNVVKFPARAAQ